MNKKEAGLFNLLIELSGLEHQVVQEELGRIVSVLGLNQDTLNTKDLRQVLATYLFEAHHDFGLTLCDESCSCDDKPTQAAEA